MVHVHSKTFQPISAIGSQEEHSNRGPARRDVINQHRRLQIRESAELTSHDVRHRPPAAIPVAGLRPAKGRRHVGGRRRQ